MSTVKINVSTKYHTYIYYDKIYFIEKYENECQQQFLERCNFIAKQEPTKDIDLYITYSRMYINHKYYGMVYQDTIQKKLELMMLKI